MYLRCASLVLVLLSSPVAQSAFASTTVATKTPSSSDARFLPGLAQLPASTPLAEIPVYQLKAVPSAGDDATRALNTEIERLYLHAKTLPSGPDRRSLETRIYNFEKRLRPLTQSFDLTGWESLRADVRAEWLAVQATLPTADAAKAATVAVN